MDVSDAKDMFRLDLMNHLALLGLPGVLEALSEGVAQSPQGHQGHGGHGGSKEILEALDHLLDKVRALQGL